MKKIITIGGFCLLFVALFFILGTQTSCQKQKTNCACVITVDSGAGPTPVAGATVKLYAPHSTAGATGTTNGAGEVNFNFALPAIFNIDAYYVNGAHDTLSSNNQVIQLEAGQTESATVKIVK